MSKIDYNLVYELIAKGYSILEVVIKLGISLKEYQDVYDSDFKLRETVEKASKFHYENEYQKSLQAKPPTTLSKDDLIESIKRKLDTGRYQLKDIENIWYILYPEDDYRRYKSDKDVQINEYKAKTDRMKVEKDNELKETISDEFLRLLESTLDNGTIK